MVSLLRTPLIVQCVKIKFPEVVEMERVIKVELSSKIWEDEGNNPGGSERC